MHGDTKAQALPASGLLGDGLLLERDEHAPLVDAAPSQDALLALDQAEMAGGSTRANRKARMAADSKFPLRLCMSLAEAEQVRARLLAERGSPTVVVLRELIWLRAVFIEQWRRTPVAERRRFARRADRILAQLGECGLVCPSEATITVERHEKP